MPTSQTTGLSEPSGSDKVSLGTLGYIRTLNRHRQYDVVIKDFKQSGLSKADLAKRMGRAPEVVGRLLARPGNWEADTYADLLFCISGGVAKYQVEHPFRHVMAAMASPFVSMTQYAGVNVGISGGLSNNFTSSSGYSTAAPITLTVMSFGGNLGGPTVNVPWTQNNLAA